jgi:hypothetical protein
MCIDPSDATAMQSAAANEGDHISVWHRRRLMHLLVVFEKLLASADIADQQFAVNELMSTDLVAAQKFFEFSGVWCSIRQESNPDRRVDKDCHATECRVDVVRSRRRGTSRARGSEPRSAVKRW